MSHYQTTDFNEPYSSIAFRYKQPTSPYPSFPTTTTTTTKRYYERRWLHRKTIILCMCTTLFILYCLRHVILVYWAFLKIKLDNAVFDRGYVPCGRLRKQPILYVYDSDHVEIVWETNCGTTDRQMQLTYHAKEEQPMTIGPIEPIVLDRYHTVYKTKIGPIEGREIDYLIHDEQRTLAKGTFQWHKHTQDEPIRIAAMADNQFGMLTFVSLLRQVASKKPHYLLHAGDAIQNYPDLRQWQTDFVAPLTFFGLGQTTPMIYAHGNHDFDGTSRYVYSRSSNWFSFSLAQGAIHFIILDSNLDWESQDDWLQAELETEAFKQAQFRIVVVHVPPFLEYWDPEAWFDLQQSEWSRFVKDRYVPLFEASGVDVVISGHQHNYERGERNGIQYGIIGGAGGDLDREQVKDWGMYEAKLFDFHFVMIELVNNSLIWETFDLHGQRVDRVVIKK
ncbi:hypothetical protein RMATCC62417_08456 [Rhizopus microsporus]|nr:hypothetical protein RMATCC62417_08456 [Rhizopus microsporus]